MSQPRVHSLGAKTFLRKLLCVALALSSAAHVQTAIAQDQINVETLLAQNVRSQVQSLGKGAHSEVSVELKNGGTVEGYLSQATADSFTVVNDDSSTEVSYQQVSQVHGKGLSRKAKILIGVGIVVGAAVAAAVAISHTDICNNSLCQ